METARPVTVVGIQEGKALISTTTAASRSGGLSSRTNRVPTVTPIATPLTHLSAQIEPRSFWGFPRIQGLLIQHFGRSFIQHQHGPAIVLKMRVAARRFIQMQLPTALLPNKSHDNVVLGLLRLQLLRQSGSGIFSHFKHGSFLESRNTDFLGQTAITRQEPPLRASRCAPWARTVNHRSRPTGPSLMHQRPPYSQSRPRGRALKVWPDLKKRGDQKEINPLHYSPLGTLG